MRAFSVDPQTDLGTDRATVGFILCTDRDKAVAQLTSQGIATPIASTRYFVGTQGVQMTVDEAQVREGIEEEMESMRRVEQQVADFAARRAKELADGPRASTDCATVCAYRRSPALKCAGRHALLRRCDGTSDAAQTQMCGI